MTYRFEALKVKYFSTNENHLQKKVVKDIQNLLQEIISKPYYNNENLEYWYKGSREFSLSAPSLFFLYKLLERDEKALWLEECFYLSIDLKDEDMQTQCLDRLRVVDKHRYNKWTQEAYYLALQENDTKRAIALLKDMAKRSLRWREELAKYYVELQRYKDGSDEYMILYKGAKSKQKRSYYLLKALEALEYGSLMKEASTLARKYEALYYKDKQMSKVFIKLYLRANMLDDAKRVSIYRLKYLD